MIRSWNEAFAALADVIPVPLLVFGSFVLTLLIALGWYFWPAWLPWRWRLREGHGASSGARRTATPRWRFRLGRLRWRLRRRPAESEDAALEEAVDLPPDELPDLPAAVLALTADELAEAGRYAEAVRERMRAIVRDLIERQIIPASPGWTVTELARQAAISVPPIAAPLDSAAAVFSGIWYGLLPATAADDAAMRTHADAAGRALADASRSTR